MFRFGQANSGNLKGALQTFYRHIDQNGNPNDPKARYDYNAKKIPGMFQGNNVNPQVANSEQDLINKLVSKWGTLLCDIT